MAGLIAQAVGPTTIQLYSRAVQRQNWFRVITTNDPQNGGTSACANFAMQDSDKTISAHGVIF